jgi:hypothetical protein
MMMKKGRLARKRKQDSELKKTRIEILVILD